MLYDAALVLEGGAMRGNYSTGITDTFLAHHIEFKSVIGVSAGALCGAQYVAKQYGRMLHVNTYYRKDRDYISMWHLFNKQQDILNLDFLFQDHGWNWNNYDEAAYRRSRSNFTIVATRLDTGNAVTFTNPVGQDLVNDLKASCSMPFLMEPQITTAGLCMDGGVAGSIPYNVAKAQGFKKVVVVRTRPHNYHKKLSGKLIKRMYHHSFKDYPAFAKTGINRPRTYNHQVNVVNRKTKSGEWFSFAPDNLVKVGRLESDVKKLEELYHQGQSQAESILPAMINYLEK